MSRNRQLASLLDDMARMLELLDEDTFRVSAHARAARLVEDHPSDIAALDRPSLLAIKGIGPKLADKIVEFAGSGAISEHTDLAGKVPPGLMRILQIPGLGPKTVRAMWQELGITDVPALERAIADGSLLTLPRMGEKAVEKIKSGLAFAKANSQRLRLGEAARIADVFVQRLGAHEAVAKVEAAGSLRRGKETIGDVDILVALKPGQDSLAHAVGELFRSTPGVTQILSAGEGKSSVRVSLDASTSRWNLPADSEPSAEGAGVQIDLRVLPLSSWGSGLMYFTGSKEHNVRLRERALSLGLTLNDWGLFPLDKEDTPPQTRGVKPVASRSEEEIFAALHLPWIPPEAREDRGEIEQEEPWRLLELHDIGAELHAHTTASDGSLSIEQLITHARARGFHSIAITDHSQSSTIANGLEPDRLRRHIDAVRAAGSKFPDMQVFAGSEVDILADGSLDYDDELLFALDVVIASPHAALSQDSATSTARLLRAIRHPLVHILGHPTGRLINARRGLEPDMRELFAAARDCNVALEINAHWMRLDLRDGHVRAALEAGCCVSVNCDVHSPEDSDNLRFGVATARRGWVTPDRCINAFEPKALKAWLEAKRPGRSRS